MTETLIGLVIGIPWLGALVLWRTQDENPRLQHTLAVAFSIAAGCASLALIFFSSAETAVDIPMGAFFGSLTFTPDGLAVALTAIACVIGSLAVVYSVDYMKGEAQLSRYYTFVLLFIGAMAGLVLSGSLLFMFFFWEITALCSYALISFYNDDPKAVAGGIKALIITQVGGVGLLAGALITYATLGTYQVSALLENAGTIPANLLAFVAFGFLIAAAAKSAQFPFHTWLPDAMEAPTPISALIHAATMVNAGVYLLARFYPAFVKVPGWALSVTIVGLVSALITAFMALTATDLKRALAYSTVSQLGYMVYAIGVGGFFASQFHLLSHAVFKALLFLAAGSVIHSVGTRDMRRMGALGKQMPFVRNVFILGALALAGLPILNGFWSKELILEVGLADGPIWAYVGMLLGAGMTAFYTLRMTWLVFFGEARDSSLHVHGAGSAMKMSFGLLVAGTLSTWLLAGLFSRLFHATLPFHSIHELSTPELVEEIFSAPSTYIALTVIGLGLGIFWLVRKQSAAGKEARFDILSRESFGFDWLNRQVTFNTFKFATVLQETQTGKLNWNVIGILGALLIVLVFLIWSA
ncbi:MAG: NADH-quinone oxidoreductase subunit L [Anaerolineales bacterium]|uniref:NADH-quinone oxidoreductase subunit 5 family protein n=1 Tax=Candidatus Villigracilis vicinus TaxID=3140679 RepID=UPI00313523A3|nr:NADH-quinone oxidoreductase subunit L [Anaerolineales bacterium]